MPHIDDYEDEDQEHPDDNIGNRAVVEESSQEEEAATATPEDHPYAALTPDTVLDAVESLGLWSDARTLALNSYENRVYQVGIEDKDPVIVKFYRPERWTNDQILEEHQFSQELFDRELSVVPPTQIDGRTLFEFQGFRFTLYRRQGGHAPELDNLDNLYILGQTLGRMHAMGQDGQFEHRLTLTVPEFAERARSFLLTHHFIPTSLLAAYETVSGELVEHLNQRFDQVDYRSIRLHGDCHPGNILWRDDQPHFVDFDDGCSGPAIQDLWMLLSGNRANQTSQMSEILEGYQEFCDFNLAELQLIEPLRSLRMMHYAGWLARRWHDPAFPMAFPWFNTERYWAEHVQELREQLAAVQEPSLKLY